MSSIHTEEKIEPLTVNRTQAAEILGVSQSTFSRLMMAGALPVVRLGTMKRYNVEELARLARVGFEIPKRKS